jgi:5-methylcytosine-specific restriction enzyme subunit McrC
MLIDVIIKEQTMRSGKIECLTDELSYDILHNQIIKAGAKLLLRVDGLSNELIHDLKIITKKLSSITDINLNKTYFRQIQLSNNKHEYSNALQLCEFIFLNCLPASSGSAIRFSNVMDDDAMMAKVFEHFLKNFFTIEQNIFQVTAEDIRWDIDPRSEGDISLIPLMRTDLILRDGNQAIVMDAKYYSNPFLSSYGKEKIRSGHLYQLFSYIKNIEKQDCDTCVNGALIYASQYPSNISSYLINGHQILIFTINLNQPWQGIEKDLLKFIQSFNLEMA